MIQKMSSAEINNIMTEAKDQLKELNKDFKLAKEDIANKLNIIKYETEYTDLQIDRILKGNYQKQPGLTACATIEDSYNGYFIKYGNTIHSEVTKPPLNVFNLEVSALNEAYFREDVEVAINNRFEDKYKSILKHDLLQKDLVFDTYPEQELTIKIQLSDLATILGPTKCNVIEIDPYLPGSFDIKELRIYEFTEGGAENSTPYIASNIKDVGIQRLVLNKKINFFKVEMDIKINHESYKNSSVVYPFGLKHIFFYDMDFKSNSYLIAEITSDDFIYFVKDDIILKTPYGDYPTTVTNEQIELYLDKENDTLTTRIDPSTSDNIIGIARNVNTIYAKVPLQPDSNLIGIKFNIVNRQN